MIIIAAVTVNNTLFSILCSSAVDASVLLAHDVILLITSSDAMVINLMPLIIYCFHYVLHIHTQPYRQLLQVKKARQRISFSSYIYISYRDFWHTSGREHIVLSYVSLRMVM